MTFNYFSPSYRFQTAISFTQDTSSRSPRFMKKISATFAPEKLAIGPLQLSADILHDPCKAILALSRFRKCNHDYLIDIN